MPTAFSILPDRFEDGRHLALEEGLQALGFRLVRGYGDPAGPDDVLISWTRHRGGKDQQCTRFECAGGRVLIAEEPHIKGVPPGLPERLYSLMWHDHQIGPWEDGGPARWASFGIELQPWRTGGREIVVREQRGIGSPLMGSPPAWHQTALSLLKRHAELPARVRPHPKIVKRAGGTPPSLARDLADAACLVTWASSDGVGALILGVPVIACAPHFLAAGACGRHLTQVNEPPRPDRLPVLERLAWSQWTASELRSGEAFESLLRCSPYGDDVPEQG